jgi:replicative DNA helicase
MEAAGALSEAPIFIDDTPAVSAMELRTKARRLYAEHDLDLIVVDYLQLMQGDRRSENRVQEISAISRGLKGLARELNVPVLALSQLSRAVESRQDKRPILSDLRESGCLSGESLVYLPDDGRYAPIRDLVGKTGFYVTSLNTATWKLEPGLVTNSFCTGVKPVYRLTTQLGRTIRLTANHKVLTISGWKRLDSLSTGERIALPRHLPEPATQTMSDAELALLGHLIGDGCTLPRHAIQYTTKEPDLAAIVADLARQVFGDEVSPRVYKEPRRSWYQVFIPTTRQITHGVRNPVSEWLDELGIFGLRSYEKHVPSKVFQQPNAAIEVFLRHLWSTDGCVQLRKTRTANYPAVYYATSSESLGRNVQSLLLRLDINARLRRIPQNGKGRDQFHIIVTGRPDLDYFVERVSAIGQYKSDSLAAIQDHIAGRESKSNRDIIPMTAWELFAVPAMQANGTRTRRPHSREITRAKAAQIATATGSAAFANLAESDVYWDSIASIEPDGVTDVYDLTVDTNHDFVANDMIMSNSIEQDADVVMFIYREEMYNEETERQNIADLIVAKHRNGPTGSVALYFRKELTQFRDLELRREELE